VVRTMPPAPLLDLVGAPLADHADLAAIDRHPWPDPLDPGRYRGLREKARQLHTQTEYAVVLDINCAFFLRCCELRGWRTSTWIWSQREFAEALMDRYLEIRWPLPSGPCRRRENTRTS